MRLNHNKAKVSAYLIAGYFFIGLHQLFEFLSIYTGNQIIYKAGLIFSISSMIFNFKATEIYLGKLINIKYVYLSMVVLIIHLISREMLFSNTYFYVRGQSHFYWGALWMFYFLYWNFIHLQAFLSAPEKDKSSLALPFASLNISFILSAIYSYTFGMIQHHQEFRSIASLCGGLLTNFEIVFDAPSIWCCFTVLQGFFLYRFIKKLYVLDIAIPIPTKKISLTKAMILSIISLVIIFYSLPFVSALSYKMILK